MKSAAPKAFDVDAFLASAGGGRTIAKYRNDEQIYIQGDEAEAIFYIQDGDFNWR
jgi:hypothetical protein